GGPSGRRPPADRAAPHRPDGAARRAAGAAVPGPEPRQGTPPEEEKGEPKEGAPPAGREGARTGSKRPVRGRHPPAKPSRAGRGSASATGSRPGSAPPPPTPPPGAPSSARTGLDPKQASSIGPTAVRAITAYLGRVEARVLAC